jgi:uncharacterized YccA/Bax inhibitor family protein
MALFKSGNPTLTDKIFTRNLQEESAGVMTAKGAITKFGFLFLMVLAGAAFTWNSFYQGVNIMPWMWGSLIGGFVVALILVFKPRWSPYLAPAYGLLEGVFVGAVSAIYNFAFAKTAPNLIMQAVGLTFGVVIAMFLLYNFRVIKATQRFKSIVFTATAGIMLFYGLALILRMFGIQMPLIHESGLLGIGLSVFIVAIAALNLILDFDQIENGAAMGAPKYMEWYCAFGLLVTVVWLYLEILRLLSKLQSRN